MRFFRRLSIVALAAVSLVGIGWTLKQYDPIYETFQKGEPPDGAEGAPPVGATPRDDAETGSAAPDDTGAATPAQPPADAEAPAQPPADAEAKDEAAGTPGEMNGPAKADEAPRDDATATTPPSTTTPDGGGEAAQGTPTPSPDARVVDEGKVGDDGTHEQWPALQFADTGHAAVFIVPVLGAVVVWDLIRRRRRPRIPRTASVAR